MTNADIDRLEKIVDAAKKISPFEHADDHFKFSDEIMLSMPLLIKSWREMSDENARLTKALREIEKKVPHKVSREEAADMACEFQRVAREALEKIEGVK